MQPDQASVPRNYPATVFSQYQDPVCSFRTRLWFIVLKVFCCSKPHRQRTCAKRACSVPHRRCMVRYAPCDRVWDAATPLKLWLRSACIGDLPNAFVLVNTGAFLAVVIANNAGLIDWLSPSFSREGASRASSNTQELSNRKTWNVAQPRAYDYTLTIAQASASFWTRPPATRPATAAVAHPLLLRGHAHRARPRLAREEAPGGDAPAPPPRGRIAHAPPLSPLDPSPRVPIPPRQPHTGPLL